MSGPGPRWHNLVIGVAVAVLIGAGIVATRRDPVPAPETSPSAPAQVVNWPPNADLAPAPGQEGRLTRQPTVLPPQFVLDPGQALPLSAAPVRRALALLQLAPGPQQTGQVFVLGDDGKLRALDVLSVAPTADTEGNPRSPFGTTALKPDGTQAAFPQRNQVVLVDLTTAKVRRLPVPGRNVRTLWQDEQLLVVQGQDTVALDPETGRIRPRRYTGFGLAAGTRPGAPILELVDSARNWTLRAWSGNAELAASAVPNLPGGAISFHPGWAEGWQLAFDALAFESEPAPDLTDRTESVFAIDGHTGQVVRQLFLSTGTPRARPTRCCAVLGWLDPHTVLVGVSGTPYSVLAWDLNSGKLAQVTRISAPPGLLTLSILEGAGG